MHCICIHIAHVSCVYTVNYGNRFHSSIRNPIERKCVKKLWCMRKFLMFSSLLSLRKCIVLKNVHKKRIVYNFVHSLTMLIFSTYIVVLSYYTIFTLYYMHMNMIHYSNLNKWKSYKLTECVYININMSQAKDKKELIYKNFALTCRFVAFVKYNSLLSYLSRQKIRVSYFCQISSRHLTIEFSFAHSTSYIHTVTLTSRHIQSAHIDGGSQPNILSFLVFIKSCTVSLGA